MSACSVATGGGLESRWRELELDWDAYKTSRRHRRSRSASATVTPSSAVVTAEHLDAPGGLLGLRLLPGSPKHLVSSLQRTSSSGSRTASAGATVEQVKNQTCRYDDVDAASIVSSVEAGPKAAAASCSCSCSCSCACAVPGCGHSSNSSCSSAGGATPLFWLGDEEAMGGKPSKTQEPRWAATDSVGRFVAIAAVGVVVVLVAAMTTAILELAMDDGQAEFLVPT
uniref:Uncharacterized protein n=1 Tax=Oryza brachyantha TaxID=4533 RepID=J3LX87_ORYBR